MVFSMFLCCSVCWFLYRPFCHGALKLDIKQHSFFEHLFNLYYYRINVLFSSDPVALKQLTALYVGRSHVCWKLPDVLHWLETNVKVVLDLIANGDQRAETYKQK